MAAGSPGRPAGEAPVLSMKKVGRPHNDPLKATLSDKSDQRRWLTLVSRSVQYSDFMDLDPPLAVDVFNNLRGAALVSVFFHDLDDKDITNRLGVTKDHLDGLRKHPHFERMQAALRDSARRLSQPRTMDQMAESAEPEIVREMYTMALLQKSPREQLKALESFVDRRSAKKGREGEQGANLMLPDRFLEALKAGMEFERHILTGIVGQAKQIGSGETEILASVVNVPREEE